MDYLPLIEKLDSRLAGWKGRLLSRAGRLVLLNSVLSSIPSLFCSMFKIPAWVIKEIDRIRRGFLWKGKNRTSGLHCLVKWEQVCRPPRQGGLGIRNLRATNSALLMKNLWKFYSATHLPWVRLIQQKHYRRRSPCAGGAPPRICSPLWRAVLSTSIPFHTSANFTLGNGAATSFWHARWSEESLLRNRFPSLFAVATHKHLSVKQWLDRFAPHRCLGFGDQSAAVLLPELDQLKGVVRNLLLTTSSDVCGWRWNSNGSFSAQSAYNFLVFDGVDDRRIPHLWSIKIPLRIKIFLWLAARNKLLTVDLLIKRGWVGPSICILCSGNEEFLEHLLFSCPFARSIWNWNFHGYQHVRVLLFDGAGDLATRWRRSRQTLEGGDRLSFDICLAATCWELWMERNHRIFEDRLTNWEDCGRRIVTLIKAWSSAVEE